VVLKNRDSCWSMDGEISASEAVIRVLEEAGIDMVFGVPGGNTGFLFRALRDHQESIRTILVRHESAASIMAEIYGRLTGKPGIAIGQGVAMLSNGLMGVLEASASSSPMLILTDLGDRYPFSHHGPYQGVVGEYGNVDAKRSFGGVTKATMTPLNGPQAVQCTQLGLKHALAGERGPVAILYHSKAITDHVGPNSIPRLYPTKYYLTKTPASADQSSVMDVGQMLLEAKHPLIIAGNGVHISQAYSELQNLSEMLGAPVTTTQSGKGCFNESHDLALGVFGRFGDTIANTFVGKADLILVVGSKLAPHDTCNAHKDLLDPERQTLVQIDIETRNAAWTYPIEHVLFGDAKIVLSQLIKSLEMKGKPTPEVVKERCQQLQSARQKYGYFNAPYSNSDVSPIHPQRIVKEISDAVNDDALIVCDAGENRLFMMRYFQTKAPGTFLQHTGCGLMGYGIPAAIVSKLIYPKRQVVAVCGDGDFGMSLFNLMTAYQYNIPIVVVVFNNSALGWVKHAQGERNLAVDFPNHDCADIARAMGCNGVRIERPENLPDALYNALNSAKPTLLDVCTSLEEKYQDIISPLFR